MRVDGDRNGGPLAVRDLGLNLQPYNRALILDEFQHSLLAEGLVVARRGHEPIIA